MAKRKHYLSVILRLELLVSTLELMLKDEANPLPPVQVGRLRAILNLMNGEA